MFCTIRRYLVHSVVNFFRNGINARVSLDKPPCFKVNSRQSRRTCASLLSFHWLMIENKGKPTSSILSFIFESRFQSLSLFVEKLESLSHRASHAVNTQTYVILDFVYVISLRSNVILRCTKL